MEPKGHLDFLLLAAIRRGQPAHGYALIAAVRELSSQAFDLAEGTVYPALRRLETQGLVTSAWDENQARPRRLYRLSERGRKALRDKQAEWAVYRSAVEGVVLTSAGR